MMNSFDAGRRPRRAGGRGLEPPAEDGTGGVQTQTATRSRPGRAPGPRWNGDGQDVAQGRAGERRPGLSPRPRIGTFSDGELMSKPLRWPGAEPPAEDWSFLSAPSTSTARAAAGGLSPRPRIGTRSRCPSTRRSSRRPGAEPPAEDWNVGDDGGAGPATTTWPGAEPPAEDWNVFDGDGVRPMVEAAGG